MSRHSAPTSDRAVLRTEALSMAFGELPVLDSVDITVRQGEILGVIGPNGSGKSTWMNCVTGQYRPSAGRVLLGGEDITGCPPHVSYRHGAARTFQLLENFSDLSVLDNLVLAGQERRGSLLSRVLRRTTAGELRRARDLAGFLGLAAVLEQPARSLSYGQQKLMDIGMALMPDPDVLLLDEPMAGVNPTLIGHIEARLRELNEGGMTLVVIEHNMRVMMRFCHRMTVLSQGRVIADGPPDAVRRDRAVIDAYFGS